MTGTPAPPSSRSGPLLVRTAALVRNLPQRLREWPFWVTQAGVLGITTAHIGIETWSELTDHAVPASFHHLPVVFYLGPIIYASLRYGTEGALLTGLWSAILALPNLLVWHRDGFVWATELAYVGVVVTVGAIVALPVERERRERWRAEATSRRLTLFNEIAALTLTADLPTTMDRTLKRLADVLSFDAACIALADFDAQSGDFATVACHPTGSPAAARLIAELDRYLPSPHDLHELETFDRLVVAPLTSQLPESAALGRVEGLLAANPSGGLPLSYEDCRLLVGVGSHLAVAIANQRLQERERHRLRSYARLVTQAQEDERRRVARELHDETAQNLVVLRRGLESLAGTLANHPVVSDVVGLQALTDQTLAGVRRSSRDLRPPVLDDLGLVSALEALVIELRERSTLTIEYCVTGTRRRLPAERELALFRIGQAALHNVEHHARATMASVELTFGPDRARLTIRDDGRGFEPPDDYEDLTRAGKLGLLGMNERALLIGGTLHIESAGDSGTVISVEAPDDPDDRARHEPTTRPPQPAD